MDAHDEQTHRVTPLELFFDLVFVFAITQVTGLMSAHPTWGGLGQGLLVLAALWWAWGAYTWLTNSLDAERGEIRLAMLAAMAAMLVVSLAVPEAFDEHGVLFGLAYLAVRLIHIALYALGSRSDRDVLAAVLRMTPTSVLAPLLLVGAGFLDGAPQAAVWVVALSADYLGVLVGRAEGWRLEPGHFAERHGLIIIIALGESIVALGVGAGELHLDAGVVAAAVLGVAVVAALWWAYFDVVAIVAERRLTELGGRERAALARDSYSYLHLPMVAGIVLFALGLKKTLADVDDALSTVAAVGLFGGVALYLLAQVAYRRRCLGAGPGDARRLVAAVACAAVIPVAMLLPAVAALAVLAVVCSVFVVAEGTGQLPGRAR